MKGQELSFNGAIKVITPKLMVRDLDKIEIIEIISEYIPDILTESILYKILVGGLKISYKSPNPFLTAGTFYQNCRKCYPNAFIFISDSSARMFKNMIMGKGSTKIIINNFEDYQHVREKFNDNFEIEPPSSISILYAILNDKKSLNKIIINPQFRHKIKSILVDLTFQEINEFDKKMLTIMNDRIDSLKFEKMFTLSEIKIQCMNKEIEMFEKQVCQLNDNLGA